MELISNFMDYIFTVQMYEKSMEGVCWVTTLLFL